MLSLWGGLSSSIQSLRSTFYYALTVYVAFLCSTFYTFYSVDHKGAFCQEARPQMR